MDAIAVGSLGYVGLSLAAEFGKFLSTIDYDISAKKINYCKNNHDPSCTISSDNLRSANLLRFTTDPIELAEADSIIIAVPAPIDAVLQPESSSLLGTSRDVDGHMREQGTTAIYEFKVYLGTSEKVCTPVLNQFPENVAKMTSMPATVELIQAGLNIWRL